MIRILAYLLLYKNKSLVILGIKRILVERGIEANDGEL